MVIGCNIKFLKKFNIENASFIRNQIAGWVGELGWGGVGAAQDTVYQVGGLSNILPSLCCAQSFHWDTCHFL